MGAVVLHTVRPASSKRQAMLDANGYGGCLDFDCGFESARRLSETTQNGARNPLRKPWWQGRIYPGDHCWDHRNQFLND